MHCRASQHCVPLHCVVLPLLAVMPGQIMTVAHPVHGRCCTNLDLQIVWATPWL